MIAFSGSGRDEPALARQRVGRPFGVLGREAEERDRVADRGQAEPHHPRVFRGVDELVDPARLEAAVEPHVGGIGEAPPFPPDHGPRRPLLVANGQGRVPVRGRVHRLVAAAVPPGHGLQLRSLVHHDLGRNPPRDRLSLLGRDGQVDLHPTLARQHVPVPAAPEKRIPLTHQEAVAGMGRGLRVVASRAAVETGQDGQACRGCSRRRAAGGCPSRDRRASAG